MRRLPSLIVALSLAHAAVSSAAWATTAAPAALDVPYLSQSEALCGGAAAAMVFRYWGDTHAGVEQFAPLVDRRAGGIVDGVLVNAITQRGWQAERIPGSIDALRAQIGRKRPVIILIDERARADTRVRPDIGTGSADTQVHLSNRRPAPYHYLVVTGVDADAVVVHDPSWGPSRRMAVGDLIRVWRPANFWALVVLPSESRSLPSAAARETVTARARTSCDAQLDAAVSRIRERGFGEADAAIGEVRGHCPDAAGPLRELAGVRFAQRRWRDAETLAAQAVARDAQDVYAWEVLASSRFVQDDLPAALDAWNRIGKPRVDLVDIKGLQHARYESIAETIGLQPNTMLTADTFGRAARRLSELPDRTIARIAYRPDPDGFATVNVVIAERALRPKGAFEWSTAVAKALVNHEAEIAVPGFTGQGELWSASWRWWSGRPRVAIAFAAPHVGSLPGVWRVDGSWESQRYIEGGAPGSFRETRAHGALSMTDWLSASVRYGISVGLDQWNGERRTASIGALLERRFAGDRVAIAGDATSFMPVANGSAFQMASVHAAAKTSAAETGWVLSSTAGASATTASAPLALWPGAGDGHARPALLRAHPLIEDGTIVGPVFGRTLLHGSAELQRWINRTAPVHFAVAGFTDVARAMHRLALATGAPVQVDVGMGLRVKVPGTAGTLRADVGHGLRDGATAITVGWQYW